MTIFIRAATPVGATPELMLLAMQACNELNQTYAQAHSNVMPVLPSWYDKGLVAIDVAAKGETIVGFMAYDERSEGSQYHISLGYVLPKYRGQGVYRRLWAELINLAKANPQIVRITRSIHVDNLRMLKVAENQGCVASVITYGYTVRSNNLRPVEPQERKL